MSGWDDDNAGISGAILRPVDVDDDESNLKDNWDDEEEAPAPAAAAKPPPKKVEKKKKVEKEPVLILTPEQLAQRKIEDEKRLREIDLEIAKEMLGAKISAADVSFKPTSQEQFDSLSSFLVTLMSSLTDSTYFPDFAEKFTRDLAVSLDTDVLKKMADVLTAVCTEKNKIKQAEKKAKKSGKGIKLRVGDGIKDMATTGEEDLFGAAAAEEGEDEYDEVADKYDFM